MTGEKDAPDHFPDAGKMVTATAEMPGEEEIRDIIANGCGCDRDCEKHGPDACGCLTEANDIKALFAPILAEKELHHVTGERITRKDLNNAHRKGAEEGRLAAHLIDGVNSPLNACCYREQCKALEARALAAEAALAAARTALLDQPNSSGHAAKIAVDQRGRAIDRQGEPLFRADRDLVLSRLFFSGLALFA